MEIKDGILIVSDEEKEILQGDLGKKYLEDNGLVVEKVVEKEPVLSDEIVKDYIKANQGLNDKLYNENALKFLKSKLNRDVDIHDLGKELTTKEELTKLKEQAIKGAVALGLKNISKHSNLLLKDIDYSKLDFDNGELKGFDDVVSDLKTRYADLFDTKQPTTPPNLPSNEKPVNKITYDDFLKMSKAERQKISMEELQRLIKE